MDKEGVIRLVTYADVDSDDNSVHDAGLTTLKSPPTVQNVI